MQAGSSNGPLQNRYLSGTGNAGGIHLPVFNNKIPYYALDHLEYSCSR